MKLGCADLCSMCKFRQKKMKMKKKWTEMRDGREKTRKGKHHSKEYIPKHHDCEAVVGESVGPNQPPSPTNWFPSFRRRGDNFCRPALKGESTVQYALLRARYRCSFTIVSGLELRNSEKSRTNISFLPLLF